jgi:predicted O-methyltransferase YrrM
MQKKSLNFLISIGLIFNFQLFSTFLQDLPEPYSQLQEVLPFNDHGWYANGAWIEKLMKYNKITTAIEIGSWLGASTRHIASLLQPSGKLYAVDTWQGSVEHHENSNYAAMLPSLYNQFLSNIVHAQLTDRVIPVRITSLEASKILKDKLGQVDFVYIDAAHDTYSVLLDLHFYWPFVENNGGILCGDDWWWDSVKVAVRIFAEKYRLTMYTGDNFWFVKNEGQYSEKNFIGQDDVNIWKFDSLQ